jgi:hypothetical protein
MSSGRRTTGRNRAKKQLSKGSTSAGPTQPETDKYHNQDLPCCRLLEDVARDIFATSGAESSQSGAPARPSSLLGYMLRKILTEERKKEQDSALGSTELSGSKKKKKKKKKNKTNKASQSEVATKNNDSSAVTESMEPVSPASPSDNLSTSKKEEQSQEAVRNGSTSPVDSYLDLIIKRQQEQPEETPLKNREMMHLYNS